MAPHLLKKCASVVISTILSLLFIAVGKNGRSFFVSHAKNERAEKCQFL
jgi:hypothetical protein